jgi:hypothetical protein
MNMTRRQTVLSSDELLHRVLSPATPLLYNTVRDRPGERWVRDSDCPGRTEVGAAPG